MDSRRSFLKKLGVGAAVAAGSVVPGAAMVKKGNPLAVAKDIHEAAGKATWDGRILKWKHRCPDDVDVAALVPALETLRPKDSVLCTMKHQAEGGEYVYTGTLVKPVPAGSSACAAGLSRVVNDYEQWR